MLGWLDSTSSSRGHPQPNPSEGGGGGDKQPSARDPSGRRGGPGHGPRTAVPPIEAPAPTVPFVSVREAGTADGTLTSSQFVISLHPGFLPSLQVSSHVDGYHHLCCCVSMTFSRKTTNTLNAVLVPPGLSVPPLSPSFLPPVYLAGCLSVSFNAVTILLPYLASSLSSFQACGCALIQVLAFPKRLIFPLSICLQNLLLFVQICCLIIVPESQRHPRRGPSPTPAKVIT